MGKQRQTRAQLEAEIEALLIRKKQLSDEAAETFTKALLRQDVKDRLADLSDAVIKQVARNVADILPREIDRTLQKMMQADVAERPHQTEITDGVRRVVPAIPNGGKINV